ncbi:hypothetical protein NEHOM01_0545 [Nematocida homosporus]|uniref:uncharacterized protein n=1 Tax=Nematocida homosporus TaxID=1912981 RepID=UPI002221137F|nr:uncharacterized protein NEHOM01_0545 [Nematocida homosporus]KAI5184994.1 hypothetical protein NEHOM01_0545 [Nematocida homosporus]
MEVAIVVIGIGQTVYSLLSLFPPKTDILLIDLECEYFLPIEPCPNELPSSLRLVHVLPEALSTILTQPIPESTIILNRIFSFQASPAEIQQRLNYLQNLAFQNKRVFATTEYTNSLTTSIRYFPILRRMTHLYHLISD